VSNPWPPRSRHFDPELGQYVWRPGEDVAEDVAVTWSSALAEAGHCLDEIDNCAARVRHGARVACKRLREERDAAVACHEKALAMLDAARLELRARKWLDDWEREYPAGGSRSVEWSCDKLRVKQSGHLIGYFDDHASAARALGWEG
jgi:hypothetical protein